MTSSVRRPDRRSLELTVEMFGGVVDLVAVERVATGAAPRPMLTQAERMAVVRRLLEDGYGPSMVSRQLRVSGDVARTLVKTVRATPTEVRSGAAPYAEDAEPVV